MGSATNARIAQWQEEAGIEPARGERAAVLKRIADLAAELISITTLEGSGIRDGDGGWYGCDPLDDTIHEIYNIWEKERRPKPEGPNIRLDHWGQVI